MTKIIKFVSLISKDDNPLYIQAFESDPSETNGEFLRYNFFSHMALDIFSSPASLAIRAQNNASELEPILLFIQDDIAVYGYETNTNLKIVIGFGSDPQVEGDTSVPKKESPLTELFGKIQKAYLRTIFNPFTVVDNKDILNNASFDKAIKRIVSEWNDTK